jgi:hypothetical protein
VENVISESGTAGKYVLPFALNVIVAWVTKMVAGDALKPLTLTTPLNQTKSPSAIAVRLKFDVMALVHLKGWASAASLPNSSRTPAKAITLTAIFISLLHGEQWRT